MVEREGRSAHFTHFQDGGSGPQHGEIDAVDGVWPAELVSNSPIGVHHRTVHVSVPIPVTVVARRGTDEKTISGSQGSCLRQTRLIQAEIK